MFRIGEKEEKPQCMYDQTSALWMWCFLSLSPYLSFLGSKRSKKKNWGGGEGERAACFGEGGEEEEKFAETWW